MLILKRKDDVIGDNMEITTLDRNIIDYQQGLERFAFKEDIFNQTLVLFLEDESFSMLKQSVSERDFETAFFYAHTLKGVCGNLSLKKLYEKIVPFVEKLRSKNYENIQNEFADVEVLYIETCCSIKECFVK